MDKDLEISIKIAERSPYRLSLKVIVSGSAMSQGDLDVSYRLLMECLTFLPGYLPAQRLISVNRLLAKDYPSALQEFRHLLALNPSSAIGMFGASLLQVKAGKTELARENLLELTEHEVFGETAGKLLQIANKDVIGLNSNYKTQASEIIKEHRKTAHDMLKELGNGSDNIRLKLVLAELLLDRGERKTAISILKRLKDSHPNYPDLLNQLAKITGNEDLEKANSIYQTIYDIQPTYAIPVEIKNILDFRYGSVSDIPAIAELDTWCETVLIQYAKQQVIKVSEKEPTRKKEPKIEPLTKEETPPNTDPVVFISDDAEKKEDAKATEPITEKTEEPETEPELDLSSVDSHQLQRARTILEQARKILDQTKNAPPELPETPQKSDLVEESAPKIEEKPDDLKFAETTTTEPQEPAEKISPEVDEEAEAFFEGDIPQRIVLPTSETENEYSEEGAWNLLKEGQAEEAFYMFSKLISKITGNDQ